MNRVSLSIGNLSLSIDSGLGGYSSSESIISPFRQLKRYRGDGSCQRVCLGRSKAKTRRYPVAIGVSVGAKAAPSEVDGVRRMIHGYIDQTNASVS